MGQQAPLRLLCEKTPREVAGLDLEQRWVRLRSARPGVFAAIVEAATRRPVGRQRYGSGNSLQSLACVADLRHRTEQTFRVRMVRFGKNAIDRSGFDNLAAIHHDDARGS